MPRFVELSVLFTRLTAIAFGRNHRLLTGLLQSPNHSLIGIVTFISQELLSLQLV